MKPPTPFRLLLMIALVLASPALAAAPSAAIDLTGHYILRDREAGTFPEVVWLHLWEVSSTPPFGRVPLDGEFRFDHRGPDGRFLTLPLTLASFKDERLLVEALEKSGSLLRFEGAFAKLGVVRDIAVQGEVILKGTLSRVCDGKVEKIAHVEFTYHPGD